MKTEVLLALCAATVVAACADDRPATARLPACAIKMNARPQAAGEGTVFKLLSQAEAMALLSRTQTLVGGPIDSAYVNNVRALVRTDGGEVRTVLIPYDMTVVVGDRVAFQSNYRSPPPLCSYVPMLVTRRF